METLFRKVLVSERLPNKGGSYDSDKGKVFFNKRNESWEDDIFPDQKHVEYWLEPVELPSENEVELKIKEITERSFDQLSENYCFQLYNYILGFINNKK